MQPHKNQNQYSVEIVDSLQGMSRLSDAWNALLRSSLSDNVFLHSLWLEAWAKCFLNDARTLFVLCVRQADELIAIAPWYIQKARHGVLALREVRFLGSPEMGSDYLDVIMHDGKEREVAEAIYEFLFGRGRNKWDEIRLGDMPTESLFLLHFLNRVEAQGKFVEICRHACMPQTDLPDSPESYFGSLSSNRRYIFNRDLRRLADETATTHVTFRGNNLTEGLARFFVLYNEKSGYDDGPRTELFLQTLCQSETARAWIQIDFLIVESRAIAGLLHLHYGAKLSMLKMVVDKTFSRRVSLGNLLVGMSITNAIDAGVRCYDFLKGDESYKFHWARRVRTSLRVLLPQRRPAPVLATASRLLKYLAKTILR